MLRLALATIFGLAGVAKFLDLKGSKKAFIEFGVPEVLALPGSIALSVFEIVIAVLFLFTVSSWVGSIGATFLLLLFIGQLIYQMAKGNAPDCHCFGQLHSEPVGKKSLARNIIFAILSLFLVIQGRENQGLSLADRSLDIMQLTFGIAIIGFLAATIYYLRKISEQQTQIMRRVELMELVARDGNSVERDDVGLPHEGLPIGALFPAFELRDVNGTKVSLVNLKVEKTPVLFFFVSPTCTPCKALVPEFEQWQMDLDDKVKLVFVSNGKRQANFEKFGENAFKNLLLQKDREVAELVRAKWTPTAVLMDRNGRIASHNAAGDTVIRELVEKIKADDLDQEFTFFTNGNGDSQSVMIGNDLPEFSLQDINGQEINTDYFRGRQTLITFWSMTCPYCVNMMDDLREWDKTKRQDEPNLLVFSDGEKTPHEELKLRSPIVLDADYKTAEKLGMFGTPSAILVNEYGKIISETATGASDIWSLIGKKK